MDFAIPPNDLKNTIDTTSKYVAAQGVKFEAEILNRQANNPKFAFLGPDHPFNAYYKAKVAFFLGLGPDPAVPMPKIKEIVTGQEYEEEEIAVPAVEKKIVAVEEEKHQATLAERMMDLVASFSKADPALESHAPKFLENTPDEALAPVDAEIMRLAARFVAKHGSRFLSGLNAREQRNPQFDFLKNSHALFPYFQQLVEAYASIIHPTQESLERIERHSQDWMAVYSDLLPFAEKAKLEVEKERASNSGEERDRMALALVDWFDFVVAGTVPVSEEEFAPSFEGEEKSCSSSADVLRFLQLAISIPESGRVSQKQAAAAEEEEEEEDMEIE
jgi:splicing factor 3A subunit 1